MIRTDAGSGIGVGHAMRCATLGAALRARGHHVTVVAVELTDLARGRFGAHGIAVTSTVDDVDAMLAADPDGVVVDGYHLGGVASRLADDRLPLVMIDDNGELPTRLASVVVNQNLHARADSYPPGPLLLIGPRYALIRPELVAIGVRTAPTSRTVLVSIGGTDPLRLTRSIVDGLTIGSAAESVIVAYADEHPDAAHLDQVVATSEGRVRRADRLLDAALAETTVAVVGGGTTLWELATLGVAGVAVIVADNQRLGAAAAQSAGLVDVVDSASGAIAATLALLADPERRAAMEAKGPALFDGRGARRVADAIEQRLAAQ